MKLFGHVSRSLKKWGVVTALVSLFIGCAPSDSYELEPPPLTPVDQFFVENNNGVPTIPDDWRLTVDGEVAAPLELTMEALMGRSAATRMATLICVGDPFDPQLLAGNANWTGVPLHDLLAEAGPLSGAQSVIFHCIDGYRVSFSLDELLQRDDDLLAYGMNGVTLPLLQGYPVRLVLPGDLGASWVQWLERIELSTAAAINGFSPIPVHAQLVSLRNGDSIEAGTHVISGMAAVGEGREITGVDISFDGGATWTPARLLSTFVPNAWKTWEFTWEASEGEYIISSRARDSAGNQQGSGGFFTIANFSVAVSVVSDGDGDGLSGTVDNCPGHPNGPDLGTCVTTQSGVVLRERGEGPEDYTVCERDTDCVSAGSTCQLEQGDCNYNGVGDACECYADGNGDSKVNLADLVTMRNEFFRDDCDINPCEADCNGNNRVDLEDLIIMKIQFLRSDCPALP